MPEPSATRFYDYRVVTGECNCLSYRVNETRYQIALQFQAKYKMDRGIATEVEIRIENNSRDTLSLAEAAAKVTSKNLAYDYNDKFVPLPELIILPGESNVVNLAGREKNDIDDWHKIAGEQLTVTLKGLRSGGVEVPPRSVTFVPENPLMGK